MRLFRQVAVCSLVCVSLLLANHGFAKTANLIHYTLEAPDDWNQTARQPECTPATVQYYSRLEAS